MVRRPRQGTGRDEWWLWAVIATLHLLAPGLAPAPALAVGLALALWLPARSTTLVVAHPLHVCGLPPTRRWSVVPSVALMELATVVAGW